MQTKPRVVFFGTPALAVPVLQSLTEEFEVVGVISQPNKPAGKGGTVMPSPVSKFAIEHGLKLETPVKLKDERFREWFEDLSIDLAVVLAYGKILPQWVLDVPKYGALNIHASLLPRFRGASPINASILAGDIQTGLTYMLMNSKMDEGDILWQTKTNIDSNDTAETLGNKLSLSASKDINTVIIRYITDELSPVPQEHTQASYCQILTKDDGRVDFNALPDNAEQMIRAYYPWPGVWGLWNNKRVKLLPGGLVQMEGKKATTLADFKHGYPDFPLSTLPD